MKTFSKRVRRSRLLRSPLSGLIAVMSLSQTGGAPTLTVTGVDAADCSRRDLSHRPRE